MRSCKTTTLRQSFSIIWILLLVFTFLLPIAITDPAFAMTNSPQSEIKENHELPPSVLKAVQNDLSKQTNLPIEEFQLTKATHESWTDGCLGLGKPEEMCSQALIDGWRVIVARGKQTWVYRTDTNGRVIRQEQ